MGFAAQVICKNLWSPEQVPPKSRSITGKKKKKKFKESGFFYVSYSFPSVDRCDTASRAERSQQTSGRCRKCMDMGGAGRGRREGSQTWPQGSAAGPESVCGGRVRSPGPTGHLNTLNLLWGAGTCRGLQRGARALRSDPHSPVCGAGASHCAQ